MIRINLLPVRFFRRKENIRKQVSIFVLTVIFILGAMGATYALFNREADALAIKRADLKDQVARLEQKVKEADRLKKEEATMQDRLRVIFDLEAKRRGPIQVLDEVSRRLPPGKAWLDGLDTDKNKLSLKGKAIDNETIALFMSHLGGAARTIVGEAGLNSEKKIYNIFKDVELVRAAQEITKELRLKNFQITCTISLPEEQAAAEKAAAEKEKKDPKKEKK